MELIFDSVNLKIRAFSDGINRGKGHYLNDLDSHGYTSDIGVAPPGGKSA